MISREKKLNVITWSIVCGIAIAYLVWALCVNFVIGNRQLKWEFGIIPDIPGESFYSTHHPTTPHGMAPGKIAIPPRPQHVMGRDRKSGQTEVPSQ